MTEGEFKQVMAFLSGSRTDQRTQLGKDTYNVYWLCLQDLPFDAVKGAVLDHLSNNKWFPTIAEIRQAAFALIPHERIPTTIEAWGEITKQFDYPGRMGQPRFSHPAIVEAVEALGWLTMCNSENADVLRGEFGKLYEAHRRRMEHDQVQMPTVRDIAEQLTPPKHSQLPGKIKALADAKRVS